MWLCARSSCVCVGATVCVLQREFTVWCIKAKLLSIFQNLLWARVSFHPPTAQRRQIMGSKADQLPVLKRVIPFLIYHKMSLSTKRDFPLSFFCFICTTCCFFFLSSSSVFARVRGSSFLMDFSANRFSIYDKRMLLVFKSPNECWWGCRFSKHVFTLILFICFQLLFFVECDKMKRGRFSYRTGKIKELWPDCQKSGHIL